MATAVATPSEVEQIVPAIVAQAKRITITTTDDYELAGAFLQLLASRKKQIEEVFDPIVKKAHETHKEAVAQKNRFMNPLLEAEMSVKRMASQFLSEQERIRKQEERRIAEEERKKREADAAAEAELHRQAGDEHLAELVEQEAAAAPAPVVVVAPSVPKLSGVSKRTEWKFRIVDEKKIPREYLTVNEQAIRAMVKAQKGLTKIDGVEVYSEENVVVKA